MLFEFDSQVFRIRKSRVIVNALDRLRRAPLCNHCAYFAVLRLRNALSDTRREAERKGRSTRRLRAATLALDGLLHEWRKSEDYLPPTVAAAEGRVQRVEDGENTVEAASVAQVEWFPDRSHPKPQGAEAWERDPDRIDAFWKEYEARMTRMLQDRYSDALIYVEPVGWSNSYYFTGEPGLTLVDNDGNGFALPDDAVTKESCLGKQHAAVNEMHEELLRDLYADPRFWNKDAASGRSD